MIYKITFFKVLSNWLFIWFALFIFNIIPFNPNIILIIAFFLTSIIGFSYLKIKNANNYNLKKFFIINFIFKLIPILISSLFISTINDFYFGILLIIIYLFYMKLNKIIIIDFYKEIFQSFIINTSNKSIISKYYDYIYNLYSFHKNKKKITNKNDLYFIWSSIRPRL